MIRRHLIQALFGLITLLFVMGALGHLFEAELHVVTHWVVSQMGFSGMALTLMLTDTLVTPFPPDILLAVIANSAMSAQWPIYVGLLGLVSVCAGMTGYGIGRWLGHFQWAQSLFNRLTDEQRRFIQRYGFWAVVIGAITPLPYSVTCWSAGALGIRWVVVLSASLLFRIPRFYLFYGLLAQTGRLLSAT